MTSDIKNQGEDDGVFPEGTWAVSPSKFLSQLESGLEIFIRIIFAPILLFVSIFAQSYLISEFGGIGVFGVIVTIPAISWSLTAILFTNEYRKEFTRAIISESPDVLSAMGFDLIVMIFKGFFHILVNVVKIVFKIIE